MTPREFSKAIGEHPDVGGVNLDCCTTDPDVLWEIGRYIEKNPVKAARVLFKWRPEGYVRATRDLGRYAENKATAMRCRLPGGTGVVAAQGYELICDRIYDELPAFARW